MIAGANAAASFFSAAVGTVWFSGWMQANWSEWIVAKLIGGLLGFVSRSWEEGLQVGKGANKVVSMITMFFIFWAIVAIILASVGVMD